MQEVHEHEVRMNKIITDGVNNLDGFDIIGPQDAAARGGITSTLLRGRDPHETAMLLDEGFDVFVRSGFHCVDPWFHANGESEGSLRASLYVYTDAEECRRFVDGLSEICANIPRC
jgi:cysteine desulfurase/selenocysteine lyase